MRELAVQAANGSITSADRQNITSEVNQLISELDRIAETTQFNTQSLLSGQAVAASIGWSGGSAPNGVSATIVNASAVTNAVYTIIATYGNSSFDYTISINSSVVASGVNNGATVTATVNGIQFVLNPTGNVSGTLNATAAYNTAQSFSFHIGANANQTTSFSINPMDTTSLGVNVVDVSTVEGANTAIGLIDAAITNVASQRSTLGAAQNRLEHTINNLTVASENLSASESRIRDVDMAFEMTNYTKNQIMLQAGVAMLAQANVAPQMVLQLLR